MAARVNDTTRALCQGPTGSPGAFPSGPATGASAIPLANG